MNNLGNLDKIEQELDAPKRFECRLYYRYMDTNGNVQIQGQVHGDPMPPMPVSARFTYATVFENEGHPEQGTHSYWQSLIDTDSVEEAVQVCELLNDLHDAVEDIAHRCGTDALDAMTRDRDFYKARVEELAPALPLQEYTVVLRSDDLHYTTNVTTATRMGAINMAIDHHNSDNPEAYVSQGDLDFIDVMRGRVEFVEFGEKS